MHLCATAVNVVLVSNKGLHHGWDGYLEAYTDVGTTVYRYIIFGFYFCSSSREELSILIVSQTLILEEHKRATRRVTPRPKITWFILQHKDEISTNLG